LTVLGAAAYPRATMLGRAICAGLLVFLSTAGVRAQEDDELRLFGEPTSYTDVADALDEGDAFDLNVSFGFSRTLTTGTVQRETNDAAHPEVRSTDVTGARASQAFVDVASYENLRNTLHFGLDVGLYHDLALTLRLPVVLSDTRELTSPDGRTPAEVNDCRLRMDGTPDPSRCDLSAPDPASTASVPLFEIPFHSPARSGIPYIELGAAWAIFNQHRSPELPTWLLSVTGRFAMGEPMHACFDEAPAGRDRCPNANPAGGTLEPGISDGTNGLRLESRASWRGRYMEPYAGLSFQIGWPGSSEKWFEPGGDLAGFMNTLPPRVGELTVGVALIPWEQRARWQRFALDFRITGSYVSEGHSYSALFDALGTSAHPSLTNPVNESGDATRPSARETWFYGLTDTSSHGRVTGQVGIEMQAARYVRFLLNAAVGHSTGYMLTFTDACNPNVSPDAGDSRMGDCRSGIINPHHRSVLDLPGHRFRMQSELTIDFSATAIAQF
jgi:hypothetical protein